ncbi:MAG: hypothetical protein Q7U02_14210, partial [Desulfosalsimonadaceae bacterium]|nr:hypothetical protein [Desulfosalsimonadaceae bacterium]
MSASPGKWNRRECEFRGLRAEVFCFQLNITLFVRHGKRENIMKLEIISKKPKGVSHEVPILFVHGAWHGA